MARNLQGDPELPYEFSYGFADATGQESRTRVLDWEAGALYWTCLRATDGDERKALAKVCQKCFAEFLRRTKSRPMASLLFAASTYRIGPPAA